MIKVDDCDKDVAAILGLEKGETAGQASGRSVRSKRWIWVCAALAAGLSVAIRQSPAVGRYAQRSAPIAHGLSLGRTQLHADMLLASPEDERKVIGDDATHNTSIISTQNIPSEISNNGYERGGRGVRKSKRARSATLRRSQVLARSLNLHSTTVLRLAAHERPDQHTYQSYTAAKSPNDGSSRAGHNEAKVVQAERLEAIDAIRILRQR